MGESNVFKIMSYSMVDFLEFLLESVSLVLKFVCNFVLESMDTRDSVYGVMHSQLAGAVKKDPERTPTV